MITVKKNQDTYNGLSTDTKPIYARNGDLFAEIDTGKNYMFDAESGEWTEVELGGGGGGITPTGEIEITQNGTYDVTNYASAEVAVPTSGLDADFKAMVEKSGTSITLPSDVTTIALYSFYKWKKLREVNMPSGITSIGLCAFQDCGELALTELPSGLTSIGQNAFYNCDELALTELPSGLTSIGNAAFSGCSHLAIAKIPNGITEIKSSTFSGCSNLTSIELPAGLSTIGSSAFTGCFNLRRITCLATTPPELNSYAITSLPSDCAIYVPAASVDAYKAA